MLLKGYKTNHNSSVVMSIQAIQRFDKDNQNAILGCLFHSIKLPSSLEHNVLPSDIVALLDEYADVFKEPLGLPLIRAYDHSIPLKEGVKPVVVRPYRYPQVQKNEIENQVNQMLESGVIQRSLSPFASLVILVKKMDGSWQFCVEYRQLNAITVKNMFIIPIIEQLLDGLWGACNFSKLDLRVGYHQIRVTP